MELTCLNNFCSIDFYDFRGELHVGQDIWMESRCRSLRECFSSATIQTRPGSKYEAEDKQISNYTQTNQKELIEQIAERWIQVPDTTEEIYLPRSSKKEPSSSRFFHSIECTAEDDWQIGRKSCDVLPYEKSTPTPSS